MAVGIGVAVDSAGFEKYRRAHFSSSLKHSLGSSNPILRNEINEWSRRRAKQTQSVSHGSQRSQPPSGILPPFESDDHDGFVSQKP